MCKMVFDSPTREQAIGQPRSIKCHVITNLADDADVLGQRVSTDERDPQRSRVGVVELTGL